MTRPLDKATLEELVEASLPAMLRFAIRLTNDVDQAEELVQEALVRVVRSWRSFRGQSRFETWLFRVLINVFRDQLKAHNRHQPVPVDLADSRQAGPVRQALAGELGELIARRVSELPPREREVFVLVTYEGFSTREVAQAVGISEGNVHATLHLARRRLHCQLKDHLVEK